jgi:rubrerythrin
MSIYKLTKGTDFENQIDKTMKGESQGALMYAAMAYLAGERGLNEVKDILMKSAVDELRHAALYSVLNGSINEDIFNTMKNILPLESAAETSLFEFAQTLRSQGLEEAANEIESVAKDERNHSERLTYLTEKFGK